MPLEWLASLADCRGYLEFFLLTDPSGQDLRTNTSLEWAGKFAGEVELFYLEFEQQFIENKDFRIGLELALSVGVGGANRGSL